MVGALLHYTTHHTESGFMSRPPRPKAGHNLFSVVREVRGSGERTRERDATSERGRVQLRTEPRWGRWAASPSARASVLGLTLSFMCPYKRSTMATESAFSKSRFSFLYYLTRRHNNGATQGRPRPAGDRHRRGGVAMPMNEEGPFC